MGPSSQATAAEAVSAARTRPRWGPVPPAVARHAATAAPRPLGPSFTTTHAPRSSRPRCRSMLTSEPGAPGGKPIAMPELTRDERGMVDLALLSQVVEGAFAGVMVTTVPVGSEEARIVYANPEVARMTGFSVDELTGLSPMVLLGFDAE